jgi:chaperonin GroEL (HSP60 family)
MGGRDGMYRDWRRSCDSLPTGSNGKKSKMATIVLRGATQNLLDDLERAIDDGVNVLKSLLKDGRLVPGAGATEVELAKRVEAYGAGLRGLSQHSVKRYASALEVIPLTLTENAGNKDPHEVLSELYVKHGKGDIAWGVDIEVSSMSFNWFLEIYPGGFS